MKIENEDDLRQLAKQIMSNCKYYTQCPVHGEKRYIKSLSFDGDGIHIEWFCLPCYHSGVYDTKTTIGYTHEPEPETELERDHAGNGTSD